MVPKSQISADAIKERIVQILNRYLGDDYLLFVFGSYAQAKIDRNSDIDLAVYKKGKIAPHLLVEAKEEIERKAGTLRDIDLINLTDEGMRAELVENILEGGRLWKQSENSKELLKNLKMRLASLKK